MNSTLRFGWPILAVLALALSEIVAHYVFRARAPSRAQWQQLRPVVAKVHEPGDLVAVAPSWAEPVARMTLGDSMMPIAMLARADDADFARAIEVDIRSQRKKELVAWSEVRRDSVGPFTVRLLNNPHHVPAKYRFIEHVDESSLAVTVSRADEEKACSFSRSAEPRDVSSSGEPASPGVRYSCPGGSFHWVGVTIIEDENFRPRRCIWAPPDDSGNIKLTFHQVPLGRRLHGYAGTPWLRARDDIRQRVTIAASSAREPLGSTSVVDKDGWVAFAFDTEALENTIADVQLTVSSMPGKAQWFCFTLESR